MPLTTEQARELAERFRAVSVAVGEVRFARWASLSAAERQQLADHEWTLLNDANRLTTQAVGLALDDVEADFHALTSATEQAKKVLKSIAQVKDVVRVTAGMIALGAAIAAAVASENPAPVAAAAGALASTLKDIADRAG